MAYTTVAKVKNELPYNYQKGAEKKLTEDGWINAAGTFSEAPFVQQFIDQMASFIDSYLAIIGVGPFSPNGVLEKVNRQLATYEVETYIVSASSDRVVSVSIYAMYVEAMKTLKMIVEGDIIVLPSDVAPDSGTVRLIEPLYDGATLTIGELEEKILLGGSKESSEIPE